MRKVGEVVGPSLGNVVGVVLGKLVVGFEVGLQHHDSDGALQEMLLQALKHTHTSMTANW